MNKQTHYRPANGTDGALFEGKFCCRCSKEDDGCFILMAMLMGIQRDEWVKDEGDTYNRTARCTEFEEVSGE